MRYPNEIPTQPNSHHFLGYLTVVPFFDDSKRTQLFDPARGPGSPGSQYAENHRHAILAEMIPCTTFAAGRNAMLKLQREGYLTNVDIDKEMKTVPEDWPSSRILVEDGYSPESEAINVTPWFHSDIRNKAFAHTWKLFAKFVSVGILDEKK
jgi:hypothetical protein